MKNSFHPVTNEKTETNSERIIELMEAIPLFCGIVRTLFPDLWLLEFAASSYYLPFFIPTHFANAYIRQFHLRTDFRLIDFSVFSFIVIFCVIYIVSFFLHLCSFASFCSFLMLKVKLLILQLYSFLMWAFNAIKCPLSTNFSCIL